MKDFRMKEPAVPAAFPDTGMPEEPQEEAEYVRTENWKWSRRSSACCGRNVSVQARSLFHSYDDAAGSE